MSRTTLQIKARERIAERPARQTVRCCTGRIERTNRPSKVETTWFVLAYQSANVSGSYVSGDRVENRCSHSTRLTAALPVRGDHRVHFARCAGVSWISPPTELPESRHRGDEVVATLLESSVELPARMLSSRCPVFALPILDGDGIGRPSRTSTLTRSSPRHGEPETLARDALEDAN